MYADVTLLCSAPTLSVGVDENAVMSVDVESYPSVSLRAFVSAKLAVTLLCGLALYCSPMTADVSCDIEIIRPVNIRELRSNFITLDDKYILTDDGLIFYVKE